MTPGTLGFWETGILGRWAADTGIAFSSNFAMAKSKRMEFAKRLDAVLSVRANSPAPPGAVPLFAGKELPLSQFNQQGRH